MKDVNAQLTKFYSDKVALPEAERTEMRQRRDGNRQQLESGLKRDGAPAAIGCQSQGSYAMHTMVQQDNRDYDIDDGIYFDKEALNGPKGGDKSTSDAKEMIRKAVHKESFRKPPEKLKNCVRVYYDAGYHVDIPVYRKTVSTNLLGGDTVKYELAGSEWKESDPRAVTDWFNKANASRSADKSNGGQVRRIVRYLKRFASSRASWKERMASGFMISALVIEQYRGNESRDDLSLYNTMVAISNRLKWNLVVNHPVLAGETITNGSEDSRAVFFRNKLDWAISILEECQATSCSDADAAKAWNKIFATTYFEAKERPAEANKATDSSASGLVTLAAGGIAVAALMKTSKSDAPKSPVDKRGGGKYA